VPHSLGFSVPVALLAAVSLSVTGCGQADSPAPPPKIATEATRFDFGTVVQGTPVSATFKVRNAGIGTLNIDDLKVACACGVAVAPPSALRAGESATLRVDFDTARSFGPQRRTVTLYSNDPARPVTTLQIEGAVTAVLAADPPELYLGRVRRGAQASNEARIVAPGSPAVRVLGGGKVLDALLLAPSAQRALPALALRIRADAPLGRFSETVTLARAHPVRELAVSVVGIVEESSTEAP
jgi:hypothetical protein